jgi:probable selenium-dependent hydroxylase accessory protein YqeC
LKKSHNGVLAALDLGPKEHVAVVGGGGKSTLCFTLAEALRLAGAKVISSTTTKVRQEEAKAFPRLALCASGRPDMDVLRNGLDETGMVFVGKEFLENGKVEGISSTLADDFFRMPDVDYVIVEADGAAGRPVKAPAAREPVIPQSVTMVIALMGLSALGKSLGPEVVFRPVLFKALTGLSEGDSLTPEELSKAFDGKAGLFKNTPVSARRVAFLNQLDMLSDHGEARVLARHVMLKHPFVDLVVLGSFRNNRFIAIHREKIR